MMDIRLKLTASLAALVVASTPAFAQSAATDAPTAAEAAEIIVTGTKRDEKLIEVPVAVQVFSEQSILQAGITRPQDFLALTPNVSFQTSNHAGEFFVNIRGQTSVRQSEGAVAVVIDGVQLVTQNEFNGELFDVQQIEVLKGPQGALYGRNAAAGAIVISTRPPTDDLEGQATFSYGNWNSFKANASIGGAIIPGKLRFRASAAINDTNGPFTNINTGEKVFRSTEKLGRLRLIWLASDDTTVDLRVNASRLDGGAIAWHSQVVGATQGGFRIDQIDTDETRGQWTNDVPGNNRQDKFNTSLKIDHDFGAVTFTSISNYSKITDNYQGKNYPYGAFNFAGNSFDSQALSPGTDLNILAAFGDNTQKYTIGNKAFTQEFRLSSRADQRLRWQVGFFFLTQKRDFLIEQGLNGRLAQNASGNYLPPYVIRGTTTGAPVTPVDRLIIGGGSILPTLGIDGINTNNGTVGYDRNLVNGKNYAPFGNIQYDVTEQLEIQLAARYDIEERDTTSAAPNIPNPFFFVGGVGGAAFPTYNLCVATTGRNIADCKDQKTFKQVQPKGTITYKFPSGNGSIYGGFGRSFKSGGFNPIGTRALLVSVVPDILVQDFYDKEVADQYEIGFKSVLFDRRVQLNGAIYHTSVRNAQQFEFFPTGGLNAVSSIKKVRIQGFEFDINAQVTDTFSVFGGFGLADSKITDIDSQNAADRAAIIGNRLPFASDYNVAGGFQLLQPLTDSLNVLARAEYTRAGSVWYDQRNAANTRRDPVDLVNARLGLTTDRWDLTLWARNLFNEQYNSDAVVILPIAHAVHRAAPRSFGVEARTRF
jgi:iron complex outermembrane receptor protein